MKRHLTDSIGRPSMARLAVFALGFAACFAVSCESSGRNVFDAMNLDEKQEVYRPIVGDPGQFAVISIHELVKHKRGSEKEYEIRSMYGDEVIIDKNQLLDSSDIISIEAIAVNDLPGFYKLRLNLTQDGGKLWRKLSVERRDEAPTLAFVIDGVLYRTFRPRFLYSDSDTVVIDGPFDEPTALNLEANAIRNFMYFTQSQ